MNQMIQQMQNPAANPAQKYLTDSAIAQADALKTGDYANLPNHVFDFSSPVEDMKKFDLMQNIGGDGTYALGDAGGAGKAMQLAGDWRKNMFARSSGENFQNNVRNAFAATDNKLAQAAGHKTGQDQAVFNAMQGLYGMAPKGGGFMSMLPSLIGAGTSLATKFL